MEDRIPGGVVGPVSACIISRQFKALRDGDRFFYTHTGVFTEGLFSHGFQFDLREILVFSDILDERQAILNYPIHCFLCRTIHLKEIPENPFKSVDDQT